jgi:hypothetical protein
MRKLLVIVVTGSFMAGCLGDLSGDGQVDPEAVVATFHLKADLQQALQSKECTDLHGVSSCTPYPNPMECESLTIQVRADGKTLADCRDRDGSVLFKEIDSVASVPFLCRANKDLTCQTCVDIFGQPVLDNCRPGRQSALFRQAGSGWSTLPPSSGFLEEPGTPTAPEPTPGENPNPSNPSTPTTPSPATPSTKADACHYGNALILYAKELNKILAHEGLQFHWNPFPHAFPDPGSSQNFFNNSDKDLKLAASSNLSCQQYYASIKSKYKQCPNPQADGSCKFCWGFGTGPGMTCKASRINVAALLASCGKIPAVCDQHVWSAAIVMAYGTSNKDLFQNTKSAFSTGAAPDGTPTLPTPGNPSGTTPTTPTTPGNEMPPNWPGTATPPIFPPNVVPPNWQGSPLVLDLAGDGVRPTSVEAGVRFELVGAGKVRTAWIQGDDALLALDRNGNGAIDDGTELFGSVTAGRPWEDGFQALSDLDGNQDGVVDAKDRAWGQLRLWRDSDRSGTSSPSELVAPGALGIRSIGTRPAYVAGALDAHGNDLGLRGRFTWQDGSSGLVVDVDFLTGR